MAVVITPPEGLTFRGRITIEWPAVRGDATQWWRTVIRDADTGEIITTSMNTALRIDPSGVVVAELTQLIGDDGLPARADGDGSVRIAPDGDGYIKTDVFSYLVAGMSIEGQPSAEPPAVHMHVEVGGKDVAKALLPDLLREYGKYRTANYRASATGGLSSPAATGPAMASRLEPPARPNALTSRIS